MIALYRFIFVLLAVSMLHGIASSQRDEEPLDIDEEEVLERSEMEPFPDFVEPWSGSILISNERGERFRGLLGGPEVSGDNGVEIYIFNIGQADSMLIVGPKPERKSLLIDLGAAKSGYMSGKKSYQHVRSRLDKLLGKREIDYVMISHFHSDHYGGTGKGLIGLIDRSNPAYRVGTLIDTADIGAPYFSKSSANKRVGFSKIANEWIDEGRVGKREKPSFGSSQIDLGGNVIVETVTLGGKTNSGHDGVHVDYDALSPGHYDRLNDEGIRTGLSENDLSIGVKISVGDFEFWTAGDLSGAKGNSTDLVSGYNDSYTNVEWPLVEHFSEIGAEMDVEVYRANHHGSSYSTSVPFLNAIDPEFVIYSSGKGYSHPSKTVVKNVVDTARQYATGLDARAWSTHAAFERYKAAVGGEIVIKVSPDGSFYQIEDRLHRSYSDEEEKENADIGEEDRPSTLDFADVSIFSAVDSEAAEAFFRATQR